MFGITERDYGYRDDATGTAWVRTSKTIEFWADLGDPQECAHTADDINAMVLDNTGMQVAMQANGWALVPDGRLDYQVADAIDTCLGVLEDISNEQRAAAE